MRVLPIGVGDAYDADEPNASIIVEYRGFTLLVDCGFSAVMPFWRARPDADTVDALFLTHHHADHVGGVPPLLDRWSWTGRRKELLIITTEDGEQQLRHLCALLAVAPRFPIRYARPDATRTLGPLALQVATTKHLVPNYALQLRGQTGCFAYSGDGQPTPAARALYAEADVLLHECWEERSKPELDFHSDLEIVRSIQGPERIGLYHCRAPCRAAIERSIASDARLFMVQAGEAIEIR